MAGRREHDIQKIRLEVKHRWLRPAEICEILQNYKKYHISSEPASTPAGGSIFLFNRKVQRNFRRDGHNWKKKKDGKTLSEANERLKVGSVHKLHCYYAHGEENQNFQRRSYSMLEQDLSHIVLVHYREVQGNRTNFNHVKETEEMFPYSKEAEIQNSVSSVFNPSSYQEKLSSIPGVEFSALTQANKRLASNDAGVTYEPRKNLEFTLLDNVESSATGIQSFSFQQSFSATHSDTMGNFSKQENEARGNLFTDSLDKRPVYGIENIPKVQQNWQTSEGSSNWPMDWSLRSFPMDSDKQNDLQFHISNTDTISKRNDSICMEGKADHAPAIKPLLDGSFGDGLKKIDNFDRWMRKEVEDVDSKDYYSDCSNETLNMRFGKLLSLLSTSPNCDPVSIAENSFVSGKISSFLKNDNDEWDKMLTSDKEFSLERVKEQLLQQKLKEKLHAWLLQKLAAGGKGPSVLDEGGQGVLHFGAALGYDWVLFPTITAGVSVNFRDVNGWTALHWAAFCGRERTVASLISLGAAPGALTDPTSKCPTGKTPADLSSEQGHQGIAGYLAEAALSAHLSSLNLAIKEGNSAEISGAKAAVSASSRGDGELTDELSLRDSLTAVCNATQAAARIHQVFRLQSLQRKQLKEYNGDKFGISNERALSLIGDKAHKAVKRDQQGDAVAIRIQNKFRSWKGRKDFLIIRQRIVKIQAHVRGHQVRKNYRKIVWSVGIVEKIILRWRRKGSGLRGFKPEPLPEGPSMQISSSKDDAYDVLKEGRKQTEERLQ